MKNTAVSALVSTGSASPGGVTLGTISTGYQATNAAFGGPDRRTLYVTAGRTGDYGIHSIHPDVPGYPY